MSKIATVLVKNIRSAGFKLASIERSRVKRGCANLANIQDVRSDAYPLIRERRTTQKISQIRPPYREAQKWLISLPAGRQVVPSRRSFLWAVRIARP